MPNLISSYNGNKKCSSNGRQPTDSSPSRVGEFLFRMTGYFRQHSLFIDRQLITKRSFADDINGFIDIIRSRV